jgi:hypothetical protein
MAWAIANNLDSLGHSAYIPSLHSSQLSTITSIFCQEQRHVQSGLTAQAMYCAPIPSVNKAAGHAMLSTTNVGLFKPATAPHSIVQQWNTVSVPSQSEWKQALKADADLAHVMYCIQLNKAVNYGMLACKAYHNKWKEGHFTVENNVLYY